MVDKTLKQALGDLVKQLQAGPVKKTGGPFPPPPLAGQNYPAGPAALQNPNVGQAQQGTAKKPSDQRFRSFAERYIVARAHLFRVPPNEHAQDQWECIMDAKRAYAMVDRVGRNIEPEEGAF